MVVCSCITLILLCAHAYLFSCTFSEKKVGVDEGCEGVLLASRIARRDGFPILTVYQAGLCGGPSLVGENGPKNCCGKPNDVEGQGMVILFRESRDDGNRFSGNGRARTTPKTE